MRGLGKDWASGLVNGVLRNALRRQQALLKKADAEILLKNALKDLSNGKTVKLPVDGLVAAAAARFEAWTGVEAPVQVMEAAVASWLEEVGA